MSRKSQNRLRGPYIARGDNLHLSGTGREGLILLGHVYYQVQQTVENLGQFTEVEKPKNTN